MGDWFEDIEFRGIEDEVYAAEAQVSMVNGHWAVLQVRRYPQGNKAVDIKTSIHKHGIGPLTFSDAKRVLYELKHARGNIVENVPK